VHFDPRHHADRDDNARGGRVISFSIRLPDGRVHYCVGGRDRGCDSQLFYRQVRVDIALPGSSGSIYTVSSDSVFPLTHLHTRHGDSGTLGGIADNPGNLFWTVGAETPGKECCDPAALAVKKDRSS